MPGENIMRVVAFILTICVFCGCQKKEAVQPPPFDALKDSTPPHFDLKARAERGDSNSEFRLGLCYSSGEGVAKDEVEAVKWFRKAADQNLASAQTALGTCYRHGLGVAKDYAEAVKWFRKAAEQNYAPAQALLGMCYTSGEGLAKNYAEAVRWFRKAAEQNDAGAQYNLSAFYINGYGVAKNYAEGYKWVLLAGAQGDEDAKGAIPRLENGMTREQIAEGQKLARNFKPRDVPPFAEKSDDRRPN